MVSQFVSTHDVRLLGAVEFEFPEGTHAIGRLDKASEGLLLLTTDKKITRLLFQGKQPHKRTYIVQVKHKVSSETIEKLASGILISAPMGEKYMTTPCQVALIDPPNYIQHPERKLYESQKSSWLEIVLTEGRYHQVRKMVAAVRHKCIRLIRKSIEEIDICDMEVGEVREVSKEWFYGRLRL
jgi:23S rRNA pseudouridine2457 synthase